MACWVKESGICYAQMLANYPSPWLPRCLLEAKVLE